MNTKKGRSAILDNANFYLAQNISKTGNISVKCNVSLSSNCKFTIFITHFSF